MSGQCWNCEYEWQLDEMHKRQRADFKRTGFLSSQYTTDRTITEKQFGALHVFCQQLADVLNDAGIDQRQVIEAIKEGVELPNTKESVKNTIYKPLINVLYDMQSTKQQKTVNPTEVHMVLSKWLADRFGLTCPAWPSKQEKAA